MAKLALSKFDHKKTLLAAFKCNEIVCIWNIDGHHSFSNKQQRVHSSTDFLLRCSRGHSQSQESALHCVLEQHVKHAVPETWFDCLLSSIHIDSLSAACCIKSSMEFADSTPAEFACCKNIHAVDVTPDKEETLVSKLCNIYIYMGKVQSKKAPYTINHT